MVAPGGSTPRITFTGPWVVFWRRTVPSPPRMLATGSTGI